MWPSGIVAFDSGNIEVYGKRCKNDVLYVYCDNRVALGDTLPGVKNVDSRKQIHTFAHWSSIKK